LQFSFAIFLFFVALYMFFSPQSWIKSVAGGMKAFPLVSVPIGFLSSIMGVGGGTMTVPYLLWRGLDIRKAIGISAFCGLPIAFIASVTFYTLQKSGEGQAVDFLYMPAVLGISIGSIFFAPIGAKFTHIFPVLTIKRLFSLLLIVASAKLLGFF